MKKVFMLSAAMLALLPLAGAVQAEGASEPEVVVDSPAPDGEPAALGDSADKPADKPATKKGDENGDKAKKEGKKATAKLNGTAVAGNAAVAGGTTEGETTDSASDGAQK
jgi:hypothetical protein